MPSSLIEIPSDDIFKNDRLGLEPAIAAHTQALLSRSPQAVAIDGQWGTGKSTFLALLAAFLRGECVKVVEFNAWKFSQSDPFDILTREILRQVQVSLDNRGPSHQRIISFLHNSIPLVSQGVKLLSLLQPELEHDPQATELVLQAARHTIGTKTNEKVEPKLESTEDFALALSDAARSWSNLPTVVLIDELDRCNPEYAVDMLQLLEHVFHTDNVVFVVAVNLSELTHSIRSFYGQGFNAEGYLERFFDDVFTLPTSKRLQYIETALGSIIPRNISSALLFLNASGLSLREVDKSVQHLSSIVNSHPQPPLYTLTHLWIARSIAPVEYRRFIVGEISDKAMADAVFEKGSCNGLRAPRQMHENACAQELELTLIKTSCLLSGETIPPFYSLPVTTSELYGYHEEMAEKELADGNVTVDYSRMIVDRATRESNISPTSGYFKDLRLATQLLEREVPLQ